MTIIDVLRRGGVAVTTASLAGKHVKGSHDIVVEADALYDRVSVDDFDADARTGWNVTVVGPSRVIGDARDVRRLDALGARPWVPGDDPCYIGVRILVVGGRRVRRALLPA